MCIRDRFYDISTLLLNTKALTATVKRLADEISQYEPDIIAGIESRGFLMAGPVAIEFAVGVQMIRKKVSYLEKLSLTPTT